MAAVGAALRLRLLYRMLRVGELLALVVLLSWSSSRVPSAAAAVLRFAGSLLLDPRFVFVLGNAIVLLLLALSRHDLSLSSNSNHPTTANANAPTPTAPAAASFPSSTTPTLPPVTEAPAAALAPEVPVAAAVVFEDKQPVRVNKARAPRRSRSEKMGPRGVIRRAASPELRRSQSENGRRRRSSVTARDAEGCWGLDDPEEFRRTVEAFIAKQTRFHREESMTMAVGGGGRPPPPAPPPPGPPAGGGGPAAAQPGSRRGESARLGEESQLLLQQQQHRCREDWEIDPPKLVIKGVIARGTFGTVHRGVYDGQDVAVKLLDWGEDGHRSEQEIAALRAAFAQEVSVWYKLDHPNVTKFIGAIMGARDLNIQTEHGHLGMPSNICCVVVEYLAGGALKNFLIKNRRRKLAFKVVVQIALDLARGLSYLHSKKIVHRDVKTENMLLDKTRTVKIADFGVARVEASNPSDMTGETGTLGYMAPEVLNGHPYNRKCDVYSFGICLWEIYCCDMPYPDLSFSEVTSAVVRQNLRPEIPRCCPSSLANVMKRCWDANPDKRPEMAEVVSMLEAIDTSKGGGMIPIDQPQGCFSCFRRYRGP